MVESVFSKVPIFPLSALLRKNCACGCFPRICLMFSRWHFFFKASANNVWSQPHKPLFSNLFFKRVMHGRGTYVGACDWVVLCLVNAQIPEYPLRDLRLLSAEKNKNL